MCRYTGYHNLDTKFLYLPTSHCQLMAKYMGINGAQLAGNRQLCRLEEFFIKNDKKSFPVVLVTVNQHEISWERMCNFFMKLLKKVLLPADRNCEAT